MRQDIDKPDGSADRSLVDAKFCPNFVLLINNDTHRFTLLLRAFSPFGGIEYTCQLHETRKSQIPTMLREKLFRKKYLRFLSISS
jgi:hypothetical protein